MLKVLRRGDADKDSHLHTGGEDYNKCSCLVVSVLAHTAVATVVAAVLLLLLLPHLLVLFASKNHPFFL